MPTDVVFDLIVTLPGNSLSIIVTPFSNILCGAQSLRECSENSTFSSSKLVNE